ncbi:DUF221 domain protein [Sarocladium implicatum]|nr:DUF221 domain protein [Sarocladium implicatum]
MSFSRKSREENASSSPELPPALRPKSSNKRKRATSHSDQTSYRSTSVASGINPHSHSPSTVRQLSIAGGSIEDDDPTQHIKNFPHRRFPLEAPAGEEEESEWDEADGEPESERRNRKNKRVPREPLTGHNAVLLRLIYENLDKGDIEAASRFYGHLLQLRDGGRPITVRQNNLWAIGAEILMREGERPVETHDMDYQESKEEKAARRRWGRAANMPKVRAYYDTLIREFPYDYRQPDRTSAVDFWLALINCEFYNTYTEQALALERIDDPELSDGDDGSADDDDDRSDAGNDGGGTGSGREKRDLRRKEDLRKRTLSTMEGLAAKMGELMSEPPYSKLDEFKRIRAMISLYIADLMIPHAVEWEAEMRTAQERKLREQDFARELLHKVQRHGGKLDKATREFADPDGEIDDEALPMYSSLPIRGA